MYLFLSCYIFITLIKTPFSYWLGICQQIQQYCNQITMPDSQGMDKTPTSCVRTNRIIIEILSNHRIQNLLSMC